MIGITLFQIYLTSATSSDDQCVFCIPNERSDLCIHFSFNYFALNGGSLIFFYNKPSNLLFVNAPVTIFAPTIICAMHKNTKIIFFHN